MHLQQHHMAAMVQYQKQQQQHQHQQQQQQQQRWQQKLMEEKIQQESTANEEAQSESNNIERTPQYKPDIDDDDVAIVSEEEQFRHEGFTSDASIERLAQAWRDAEAEYAQEFDELADDYYDASDLGGMYSDEYYQSTISAAGADATTEPQYIFSEASQNYGCLQTITTDIAPQNLSFPDNLFEQGMQHFDEGNISEAILCFESTLRNIDPEHADAWRMLGKCHTEHDEDQKAIVCWLRSLERDPFSPETLLALGVAYVNELDHERAIETLKNWVSNHPLYAGMVDDNIGVNSRQDKYGEADLYGNPDDDTTSTTNTDARQRMRPRTVVEMRDVERLLLRALEYDRTDDAAADVYEALGVVYNVSRDYTAAANAFRRAIDVRPMDYQLRNKLGATLANSNRSDEALPFYRAALSLKPRYARGWLNMAISHSNLHNYDEAVRCYLQTLSLNPDARHVWSYLRIALTCSEKWDLLGLAASQNLSAFHEYYDFVEY
jgi:peroxin-5